MTKPPRLSHPILALAVLFWCSLGHAQSLTNLAGIWNGVFFGLPSELTTVLANGLVTDVPQSHLFEAGTFQVTVQSDGTLAGEGGGNLAINGQGAFTVYPAEGGPISMRVNSTGDVFVGISRDSQGSYFLNGLNIGVRAPSTVSAGELAGDWRMVLYTSPQELIKVMVATTNGSVLGDLLGLDTNSVSGHKVIRAETGTMTINADGTLSGNAGDPITGTYTIGANGQIDATIDDDEGSFSLAFFVNASKDTMIALMQEFDYNRQEIVMLTKNPAGVSASDLKGVWKVTSFHGPAYISLPKNSNNVVTAVIPSSNFDMSQQSFNVGNNGFLTGIFDGESWIGTMTAGSAGLVTLAFTNASGESQSHTGYLNASKNCVTLVEPSSQEEGITVLTRAPEWPGTTQDMGLQFFGGKIVWAPDENRVLQATANPSGSWTNVAGTLGGQEYEMPLTNAAEFYRVGTE